MQKKKNFAITFVFLFGGSIFKQNNLLKINVFKCL